MPVCVAGAALCLCACFKGLQVLGVCCAGCHCVRLSVCLWCLRCVCAVSVVRPAALCVPMGGVRCCVVCVVLSIKSRVYSDF